MLVVSRRLSERILIPDISTAVTVLGRNGGSIKLGFECDDKTVRFLREELVPDGVVGGRLLLARSEADRAKVTVQNVGRRLAALSRKISAAADPKTLQTAIDEIMALVPAEPARKARVMVVEDDDNQRTLLAGFLGRAGIEVVQAEDGAAAINTLRVSDQRPDVVLLDMVLPGMDGCEVANTVRKLGLDIKIFMMTGNPAPTVVPPVDRWLPKPLNPERLLAEISKVVGVT